MKYLKKVWICTFVTMLICCICNGCSNKGTDTSNIQEDSANTESQTEYVTESDLPANRNFTIPKNKKEYEELFGTKNESGRWIPPEDSYVDPKSGNILNREGVVIGTTNTKPNPDAVG